MMPASLNFRAALPMVDVMNAIAQVSAAPLTGPKLDNRRVLAGIVDLLIVAAGALVVLYAGDSLSGDRQGALGAVILGWALYYYFALESGSGQTVGKKLMNLRVVRADGRPAGMREIAVRTVLRVIDGIGLYIVGLVVMLMTGQRRQRVGDLAAGTIVVDASGPATAVAEPAAPEADADEVDDDEDADAAEADEDFEAGADADEEPVAEAGEPTRTITLPSRPSPPETLSHLVEPAEGEAEPVAEDAEPVEDFEVEPYEVKPFHVEPIDLDSVVPVEPANKAEEPVVEVDEPAEEPVVEVDEAPQAEVVEADAGDTLPPAMSPSLEGLAADVAATQDADRDEDAEADADDDEPVNVKSVETVSAMDLIMGAEEEDSAKSDEDDPPPASA
jgi:uncharacterized RDD family membrane protein YckC